MALVTVMPGMMRLAQNFSVTAETITTLVAEGSGSENISAAMAFAKGDVPSGQRIVIEGATSQAEIKSTWPDGSARHALISGKVAAGTHNVQKTNASAGTALTKAALIAAIGNSRVVFSAGVTATFDVGAQLTAQSDDIWRQGAHCLEMRCYEDVTSQIRAIADVQYFADGTYRIRYSFEIPWLLVSMSASYAYTATMYMHDTQAGQEVVTHRHHTSWSRAYWSAQGTHYAKLNTTYLQATKMVPQHQTMTVASADLDALRDSTAPMDNGDHSDNMQAVGYQAGIGPLTKWDSTYIVSGADERAHTAMLANADGLAAYGVMYRDEGFSDSYLSIDNRTGMSFGDTAANSPDFSIVPQSGSPYSIGFNTSHHPSAGYCAYLVTGERWYLDIVNAWASFALMYPSAARRSGTTGIFYDDSRRGVAWARRNVAQAAVLTNDAYFEGKLENNFDQEYADYVTPGTGDHKTELGTMYVAETDGTNWNQYRAWFMDFEVWAIQYCAELEVGGANVGAVRNYVVKWPIGRMGEAAGDSVCYRYAPIYNHTVGAGAYPAGYYTTFNQIWDANFAARPAGQCETAAVDTYMTNTLTYTPQDSSQMMDVDETTIVNPSYFANLLPAVVAACDSGVTGGNEAWAKMIKTSNSQPNWADYNGNGPAPQWALEPRTYVAATLPTWAQGASGTITQITATTTIEGVANADGAGSFPGNADALLTNFWSGGALVTVSGQPYLLVAGGGHNDGAYNGILKYGPLYGAGSDTPEWSLFLAASAVGDVIEGAVYSDGRQAANHTYNNLVGVGDTLYSMGTDAYYSSNGFSSGKSFAFTPAGQTALIDNPRNSVFGGCDHYNGKIYYQCGQGSADNLRVYTIATDSYTEHGPSENYENYVSVSADTDLGGLLITNGAETHYWDIAGLTFRAVNSPTGYDEAMVYDPDRNTFVVPVSNSLTVYECDAVALEAGSTPAWTSRTFTGDTPAAEETANGIYGRFNYVSELGGYIYAPNSTGSVYFYRAS